MFASTVLNYMDRQAVALVGPQLKQEFAIDNLGFGWVMAAFQLTYAFFQWPSGYLADRWNVRLSYAGAVFWWSLAGIATAYSPTLAVLMTCRAFLGMGESFNWPCALRVTSAVLPPADRSLGNGIFNSGAAIGAVLTPLLVTPLAVHRGWRYPFVMLGCGGLIWVVAWLLCTGDRLTRAARPREPSRATGLAPGARLGFAAVAISALVMSVIGWQILPAAWRGAAIWWGVATLLIGLLIASVIMPPGWLAGADWARSLGEIVRRRQFWVAALVGTTINVTWHFLVNWMPTFFQEERSLGMLVGGMFSALPFLAADLGNLGGGGLVQRLTRRGLSTTTARKRVMVGSFVLVSSAIWVGFTGSEVLVVVLLCLAALGTAAYMANYFAFCQDVAPAHTGLVIGYLGGLGNLFAAGFMPVAGWISQGRHGFAPDFLIVGALPLAGLAALLLFWPEETAKSGWTEG